jgi:peptidase E
LAFKTFSNQFFTSKFKKMKNTKETNISAVEVFMSSNAEITALSGDEVRIIEGGYPYIWPFTLQNIAEFAVGFQDGWNA